MLLYRLNSDYNPLHADLEPDVNMDLGGAIMHGLFSWNSTVHGLHKTLGGSDRKNIKDFQARFTQHVKARQQACDADLEDGCGWI
jgi:hypothetical protein